MSKDIVPQNVLESKIFLIRGHKVMLDRDLAVLYGVETRALNQAVRRNISRFPADFMFSLSRAEIMNLSRSVISPNIKHAPGVFAFTEHGIAMLSSVLRSERAVQVNIQIVRAFVRLRGLLASHRDLARRLDELERRYDAQFKSVFDAIKALMAQPEGPDPKHVTGFRPAE